MRLRSRLLILLLLPCVPCCFAGRAQEAATAATFHNPLLPTGPDPWVVTHNAFYYYMNTTGKNLTVWKTRDITDLAHAEKKVVWTPQADGPYSKEIWAPELHRLDGAWYIYFAADEGKNESHRIYVVENKADDLLNRPAMPHVNVNEGPEILKHADDIFLVYSASACWTDYYELGVVRVKSGANLLDAASWAKYDHAFFKQNREAGVFGPGHNGFFKSPDGRQDWIIYHANAKSQQGCGQFRSPRIQPFTWNADGTPNFGEPVSTETAIPKPSGQ